MPLLLSGHHVCRLLAGGSIGFDGSVRVIHPLMRRPEPIASKVSIQRCKPVDLMVDLSLLIQTEPIDEDSLSNLRSNVVLYAAIPVIGP